MCLDITISDNSLSTSRRVGFKAIAISNILCITVLYSLMLINSLLLDGFEYKKPLRLLNSDELIDIGSIFSLLSSSTILLRCETSRFNFSKRNIKNCVIFPRPKPNKTNK